MSFAKTYEQALATHKPMKRSVMRSRSSVPKSRKRMKPSSKRLGSGKKTKAWDKARALIKQQFEKAGITTCELRGSEEVKHECGNDNYLGFAHDAKRRKLRPEDLTRVILVCNFAHDIFEIWPAEKMKALVNDTIKRRQAQPQ